MGRGSTESEPDEAAIVVGLRLPAVDRSACEESLDELATLARASGARVVGRELQSRSRVDGRTFIGAGKAAEIAEKAGEAGANLLLLDHDLSPAQARNLEEATHLKVLDRTELILDIFARRARTPRARIQVEAAQLEYMLPRLTRLWEHLSRLGGGIGTRGPGETQIEVDRRRIRSRLANLKKKLRSMDAQGPVRRRLHDGPFRVALVGYTNAGKSSLMNAMTKAKVPTRDRFFETLDATTRVLPLGPGYRATLTDTVGFLRRLPHTLVESFRATLEEVSSADLLLHVVDAASPVAEEMSEAVESVLREIGAGEIPTLTIFNKMDIAKPDAWPGLCGKDPAEPDTVHASALTGDGLGEVCRAIRERISRDWIRASGPVPVSCGRLLARLRSGTNVLAEDRSGEEVRFTVIAPPEEWQKLRALFADDAPELFSGNPGPRDHRPVGHG
ncbi:MAG: GTPase HflX [Gemmatimonadota bacterium]|nr:GTPase HflX [Gemmatimonadota bacterium]MDP7030732.1 GTPase HflX [Gemmatimonadota bacterium]